MLNSPKEFLKQRRALQQATARERKGLSITAISDITGIPYDTLKSWKVAGGYREKLFLWLKDSDESELIKRFK